MNQVLECDLIFATESKYLKNSVANGIRTFPG